MRALQNWAEYRILKTLSCRPASSPRSATDARGARIASVCSGAYVLAEAGLLDGRRATTHWRRTSHFRTRYPNVRLEPDRIFVRDGDIWTSAGITAGIDLALALVALGSVYWVMRQRDDPLDATVAGDVELERAMYAQRQQETRSGGGAQRGD